MNSVARAFVFICALSIILGVIVGVNNVDSWFPEATHQAVQVDFIFKFMLIASIFVFLLVHVYLLFFAFRFRRRPTDAEDAVGEQIHGNTQLEIVWSILPAIFLVFLAALCFGVWDDMHTARANELQVNVTGHQFFWEFRYPQYGTWSDTNDLYLPVNSPIVFKETSSDVIHSFWVPEFRVKQDAVPGMYTYLRVQTRRTGTYPVICTEFCGVAHAQMVGAVHILSQAAWNTWVRGKQAAARQQPTAQPSGPSPVAGGPSFKAAVYPILQNHCATCHIQGQFGGLSMTTYSSLIKGGSTAGGGVVNGAVIVPGNHQGSYLWDAVEGIHLGTGARMPLGGPYLSQSDIDTIAKWIDAGAKNN
jgi:cytochrome c oxidase subunit 2